MSSGKKEKHLEEGPQPFTCLRSVSLLVQAILILSFIYMSWKHLNTFSRHPTGTKFDRRTMAGIPLPGISVCSSFFDHARVLDDLGLFSPWRPKSHTSLSRLFYEFQQSGEPFNMTLLWTWYYGLDKIQYKKDGRFSGTGNIDYCIVGGMGCTYPYDEFPVHLLDPSENIVTVEVPAGKWVSRFMMDSAETAHLFLCHTLVPNVTLDFSLVDGNAVGMTWNRDKFAGVTRYFEVYIHDPRETVSLSNYFAEPNPKVTFARPEEGDLVVKKRKIQLFPSRFEVIGHAQRCSDEEGYSKVACDLAHCWDKQMDVMADFFAERFNCTLPGVLTQKSWPVCDKIGVDSAEVVHGSNESLGLNNLIEGSRAYQPADQYPDLVRLPIGRWLDSSPCQKKCVSFTYRTVEESFGDSDEKMYNFDFYAYFPSSQIEYWTEREAYTGVDLLSDIGGAMGLLLGSSVLSLFAIAVELGETVLRHLIRIM